MEYKESVKFISSSGQIFSSVRLLKKKIVNRLRLHYIEIFNFDPRHVEHLLKINYPKTRKNEPCLYSLSKIPVPPLIISTYKERRAFFIVAEGLSSEC